jgi:hypothetical protein
MGTNGWGGGGGYGVSDIEYSCAHGARINFGDLTPYLTFAMTQIINFRKEPMPATFWRVYDKWMDGQGENYKKDLQTTR